jgi:ATP-dependent helicase YprA (DUF1998 family)/very-short-patch-repair endonuclease
VNVFQLRDHLIGDYRRFISSFIRIRDPRIRDVVEAELGGGHLWPAPLIQLNPAFMPGAWVDDLVSEGTLSEECRAIFRRGKEEARPEGDPLRLHLHQEEAIRAARAGENYVLTTGTGSGKSLAYIVPIVDAVVREGPGRGVSAIIVYPMNALANSQSGELEKFLGIGVPGGSPVRFARYTGQERGDDKSRILSDPPDIILTNYVMLELMLTRPEERSLIAAAEGLRFLVLDELHTYRGRQGADVAYLVRRVRDRMGGDRLQCVGTSATLAGPGSAEQQRVDVAQVATKLFGTVVHPHGVITETLRRATPEYFLEDTAFLSRLTSRVADPSSGPPTSYGEYEADPLSSWLESTVGVQAESAESQRLVRAQPRPLTGPDGLSELLSAATGSPVERCREAIEAHLLGGYQAEANPETGFPPFAFRLHQFVSRGDTVYATPEAEGARAITLEGRRFVPNDRSRGFLPLVFCRECGQEYYSVTRTVAQDTGVAAFAPRELSDRGSEDGEEPGFLFISRDPGWPSDDGALVERVPEDWLDGERVRRDWSDRLPRPTAVNALGVIDPAGTPVHFVGVPFRFCLTCGVAYSHHQKGDFGKLASLATEGRSTATTVMVLSALKHLKGSDVADRARKLLSFTDNRQDASLQAGHLNDFVEVGLQRSALYRAVAGAGATGIDHDELTQRVFDALGLPLAAYASNPDVVHGARRSTDKALRDVLGYRLYRDLQRGWRITLPNLEQCGLLTIEYPDLKNLCGDESLWSELDEALASAAPTTREAVCRVLLDYLRRELAIKVDYLDPYRQERIQQASNQHLKEPWGLDDQEQLLTATVAFPRSKRRDDGRGWLFVSARGGFGTYLRRPSALPHLPGRMSLEETDRVIRSLFRALARGGILEEAVEGGDDLAEPPGYQLVAAAFRWCAGDGTAPFHDAIRVPRLPEQGASPNPFFSEFYRSTARELLGFEAREHTAQVPGNVREEREARFRDAALPILFCSPTMELGVDISELNVVSLRNVPPTAANYAQRSGRAGRSGQPALVFTYCSTFSAHDQYFFRRPQLMVQGAVAPPRLDLVNEDLVRAHVQAIWLAEAGTGLGQSLRSVLDVDGDEPSLELLPSIRTALGDPGARRRALSRAQAVLSLVGPEIEAAPWFDSNWVEGVINGVALDFERACERWRELYRAAREQYQRQSRIRVDHSRPERDRREAVRLQRDAATQLELLTDVRHAFQSDFYSYRYFASEGFLPGYAFPRLPLSAYIPGRRRAMDDREFVSRPRFLAISEFGPRAFLYHEGARYQINQVILPVDEGQDPTTTRLKHCEACGYVHPVTAGDGLDRCEACDAPLPPPLQNLLRLHNVSTRRRDRISADEEERTRYGYELRTGFRFGNSGTHSAEVMSGPDLIARLQYGHPVRLYRLNVGWTRRENANELGFVLDVERGYWASNRAMEDNDPADPLSNRLLKVIPFVDDWKNALIVEPVSTLSLVQMASLQAALKSAVQLQFQLEEQELAVESLPSRMERRRMLLYEAAEGGAGVLRRLVEDPAALPAVARRGLDLCHFDPDTLTDLRRAPRAREDCEAACYDCLMSYSNQLDHDFLDRAVVRDLLAALASAEVRASPTAESRAAHLARLMREAGSGLERSWLSALEELKLRLPSRGQARIHACATRPDFLYDTAKVVIYVDGPAHEFPERQARDAQQDTCLENLGYRVLRFTLREDWRATFARYPGVFGEMSS